MRPWESLSRRDWAARAAGRVSRGNPGSRGGPSQTGRAAQAGARGKGSGEALTRRVRWPHRAREKPAVLRVSGSFGSQRRLGLVGVPRRLSRPPRAQCAMRILPHLHRHDHRDLNPFPADGNHLLTIIRQPSVRWVHATVGIPVAPTGDLPAGRVSGPASLRVSGSFGFLAAADLGFVRILRRFCRDRPEARCLMGIIPHFRRRDHRDLSPFWCSSCGDIGLTRPRTAAPSAPPAIARPPRPRGPSGR
jgi:hypothetical protein